MKTINASTKLMGLYGNPVEHSKSPLIQNYIAEMLSDNIVYLCFNINKIDLEKSIKALKHLNMVGINVTIPYKIDVIDYLDSYNDIVDDIRSCNTIKIKNDKLLGYNTDVEGFLSAFEYDTKNNFKDKRVTVLGSGGAARGIVYAIDSQIPKSLTIINRTKNKAAFLIENLNIKKDNVKYFDYEDNLVKEVLCNSDIIINTTSVGMSPNIDNNPIDFFEDYRQNQIIYDIIYNPYQTKLLKEAMKKGAKTYNGLSMLIFQAVLAYEIINERKISDDKIDKLIKYTTKEINNGDI